MRKMKDSGIEWIGEIPENINVIRNKYLITYEKGKNPSSLNTEKEGDPYVGASELDNLSGTAEYETYTTDDNIPRCDKEDVLILWDGARAGLIGTNHKGVVSSTIVNAIPDKNVNKRYWYWYLKAFQPHLYNRVNGTTIPHMNTDYIEEIAMLDWSVDEQIEIAHYLDKKCDEIDALISAKEKTNALLKERRQSIIYEAVTKGLNSDAPMKDSGIEWIGMIPEEWAYSKAKYYIQIGNGSDPKTEGEIPVYGSGSGCFKTCGESKDGPSVLLGRKGTVDIPRYIEGKYWNVDTAFDVKTNETKLSLKYYFYLATCFDYRFYTATTTLPSMTQTSYENMYIPIPDINSQYRIIDHIESKCNELDFLISANESTIEKLREYRHSIIYEAVTGKIEV